MKLVTFYVVKDGSRDLLAKDTAISFKVLKLGVEVSTVSKKCFPNLKNVKLVITIDRTIKPVTQSCRRVRIPLEDIINKKVMNS